MLWRAVHLLVLATLAISQPLLSILGDNPTFFTAHSSSPGQIVVFAILVALAPTLVLSAVMLAGHALSDRLGELIFRGSMAVLTFLFVIQVVDVIGRLAWLVIVIAVAATYSLTTLYARYDRVRSAVSVLAVLPPFVVVYFLFFSAANSVIFPDDVEAVALEALLGTDLEEDLGGIVDAQDQPESAVSNEAEPPNTSADQDAPSPDNAAVSPVSLVERLNERFPPIYLLVFDELPWYSLLDKTGRIDPVRYPNFARLAETAHVFNNATTNGSTTEVSVTAMLASSFESHSAPVYSMYPDNLFTLLGGTYDVSSSDPLVDLCPDSVCNGSPISSTTTESPSTPSTTPAPRNDETNSSNKRSLALLFEDAVIVFGHLVVPEEMDLGLPSLSTGWGNFGGRRIADERIPDKPIYSDERLLNFRREVAAIQPRDLPRLHHMHTFFPHAPWRLRPDGSFTPVIEMFGYTTNWDDDEVKARFGQQRHLLQLGMTDRLLGEYLDRLEGIGDLDRAMVIVTADHGITFVAGEHSRGDAQNVAGIASVPLLFKEPRQTSGTVQSQPVQLVDIVPTIAARLGVDAPWDFAGRDMMITQPAVDRLVRIGGSDVWVEVPDDFTTIIEGLAAAMHAVFGDGASGSLYGLGGAGDLIGTPARDRATSQSTHCWDQSRPTEIPEPDGAIGYVFGQIDAPPGAPISFAVVVDGIVAGTARSFEDGPAHRVFAIGDSQYWSGENPVVELHEIIDSRLAPIPSC
ncbi:MAG: sulfatase-like hydrolase/transferase [Acidimicrobiaceae bacterium]|nr:sulfatase-like hydrolase/transferase [Acidimicrobiia bacterium]MCY4494008.1 sulfatase-like hydrolase/transferase [Acidimicrobiaceae bacterium]